MSLSNPIWVSLHSTALISKSVFLLLPMRPPQNQLQPHFHSGPAPFLDSPFSSGWTEHLWWSSSITATHKCLAHAQADGFVFSQRWCPRCHSGFHCCDGVLLQPSASPFTVPELRDKDITPLDLKPGWATHSQATDLSFDCGFSLGETEQSPFRYFRCRFRSCSLAPALRARQRRAVSDDRLALFP